MFLAEEESGSRKRVPLRWNVFMVCAVAYLVTGFFTKADTVSTTSQEFLLTNESSSIDNGRELQNCFEQVHENAWRKVVTYDALAATVQVLVNNTGPRVLTCLEDQQQRLDVGNRLAMKKYPTEIYQISLVRRQHGDSTLMGNPMYFTPLALTTPTNVVQFKYVIFHGNYRVQFRICAAVDNVDNLFDKEGLSGLTCPGSKESNAESKNTACGVLRNNDRRNVVDNEIFPDLSCPGGVAESKNLKISKNYPLKGWCDKTNSSRVYGEDLSANVYRPIMIQENNSINFSFEYDPCTDGVFPYESAFVTLYSSYRNNTEGSCSAIAQEILMGKLKAFQGNDTHSTLRWISERQLKVKVKVVGEVAQISFVVAELEGNKYYCATAESNHVLCDLHPAYRHRRRDKHLVRGRKRHQKKMSESKEEDFGSLPGFCIMFSDWIHVPDGTPFVSNFFPYCTSHFKCGWLYILTLGCICFSTACLLAVCFVKCGRGRNSSQGHRIIREDDQRTFDTFCLNEEVENAPKRTWCQVHDEFYAEPPKNPGKILLLYSPDSKQFKELQKSFRNFLEMACHCVVLDLFDEQLFQTICYDPEQWIGNLLKDRHFKIIVVCSEGAFKRQRAFLKGEVLNIPKVNSSLDGLFSAGLRFIQEHHAYDHDRLTLIRYESLALTKPDFKLTMFAGREAVGPNGESAQETTREVGEFVVPPQLPELFCWIHDCPGENFSGRPWDKYHLELQLLQDDLKQARRDRPVVAR